MDVQERQEMLSILKGIDDMKVRIEKNLEDLNNIKPISFAEYKFKRILLRVIDNQEKINRMLNFICKCILYKNKKGRKK